MYIMRVSFHMCKPSGLERGMQIRNWTNGIQFRKSEHKFSDKNGILSIQIKRNNVPSVFPTNRVEPE